MSEIIETNSYFRLDLIEKAFRAFEFEFDPEKTEDDWQLFMKKLKELVNEV